MRGARIAVAALAVCLGTAEPLKAGVYTTDEIYPWTVPMSKNFKEFRQVHVELGSASYDRHLRSAVGGLLATADAYPQGGPAPVRTLTSLPVVLAYTARPNLGLYFLNQVTVLEGKEREQGLSAEDRINLSAAYIYLNQSDQAIRVLLPAAHGTAHFMVLANLATAYEIARIPERALDYRRQALAAWPRAWPGWSTAQLNWYRKVEQYHLTLLRHRAPEMERGSRGAETLDPLFPKVRFVGPSGEYEAGAIAPEQWLEIPPDAISIVSQLLLWLPNDNRLIWLLGELLNAQGDVSSAWTLISDLVQNREYRSARELVQHYGVLREHYRAAEVFTGEVVQVLGRELLWRMAPRGTGLAPGAAPLASEGAWQAHLRYQELLLDANRSPLGAGAASGGSSRENSATTPQGAPAAWLPDWRHLAVAFIVGVIVTLFVQMQLREMRRRRQGSPAESRG